MMIQNSHNENINTNIDLLSFVRGDLHWNKLISLGIDISFKNDLMEINLNDEVNRLNISPHITDIVNGLLTHINNPKDLKEWAAILLGLSIIDLEALERHPSGNQLKEALWDLGFNTPIDQKTIELAERLQKS